ncbi:glycoside hydrolase family 3 protein [Pseudomaricurvus alkylphenolicus]|uniref:glycoside hydrolase family 3 protein n=1 Tax=Pseudomaricurvus alkylphenolicus TaxID=1306991 RepID=UPI001F101A97|nr:glycoside hydrolase family 3 N-terminal domain-containing protein [Pseudomaricurvus alkylphenolicus]
MYLRMSSKAAKLGLGMCLAGLVACSSSVQDAGARTEASQPYQLEIWPQVSSAVKQDPEMEKAIAEMVAKMSTAEKVGQMMQPEIRNATPEQIRELHVGSILNGGGGFPNNDKYSTPSDWLAVADQYYQASMDTSDGGLPIPVIWGTDAVHGHNNVIGATLFPHNIGLGAAGNPELIEKIAAATAREVAVTGIDWAFAPTVAAVRNDRWGRTYEGYSEAPEIIEAYAGKMIDGLQGAGDSDELLDGHRVVATVKHFIGDGGTQNGIDRGDTIATEEDLLAIHGRGYVSALAAGAQTVMASFNSWHGKKLHGHKYLLTDVLKQRMGFDGFVVGDWNGHSFVKDCSTVSCPQAIIAGVDMFMAPDADWTELYKNTLAQVENGEIPMARIDDAVTRILRVKMRAGLFDKGAPSERPLAAKTGIMGSAEHRAVARQAVRESLVLLKNKGGLLPLQRNLNVLVAGDGADDIGKQSGGWTLSWQGTGNKNSDFPGATSIFGGIQKVVGKAGGKATLSVNGEFSEKPDVAVVVFGEDPYAEGQGDVESLEYQPGTHQDLKLLQKLKAQNIPVVSVFLSGRPMWVNREINASDAFVAAWLPGSEGDGVADVLFRNNTGGINFDFRGKLTFSWPNQPDQVQLNSGEKDYEPLFAYGYGLSVQDQDTLADNLEEKALKLGAASAAESVKPLFVSRALPPWGLYVGDRHDWQVPVTSNIVSTRDSANVTISAINKDVQEDARKVTWSGQSAGQVQLQSNQGSQDLSALLQQGAALSLELRVDSPPKGAVYARMDCGEDCQGQLDIAEQLNALQAGSWHDFAIDLRCFAKAGADFSSITRPLVFSTAAPLSLSFANIKLKAQQNGKPNISCSA